jgi:hypothetical protein
VANNQEGLAKIRAAKAALEAEARGAARGTPTAAGSEGPAQLHGSDTPGDGNLIALGILDAHPRTATASDDSAIAAKRFQWDAL